MIEEGRGWWEIGRKRGAGHVLRRLYNVYRHRSTEWPVHTLTVIHWRTKWLKEWKRVTFVNEKKERGERKKKTKKNSNKGNIEDHRKRRSFSFISSLHMVLLHTTTNEIFFAHLLCRFVRNWLIALYSFSLSDKLNDFLLETRLPFRPTNQQFCKGVKG